MSKVKVKGIKFGTFAQYQAITTKDPDTLYFVTDRGGTIYRGTSLVIPQKVIENVTQTSVNSIGGVSVSGTNVARRTFTITAFSSDGSNPTTITFDVYTKEAVDAVITVMNSVMNTHRVCGDGVYADGKADDRSFGHVMLSDTVSDAHPEDSTDGIAVTPKAVYDYVQSQIGGIGGGVIFKGTIGAAATYTEASTYHNGDYCERNGHLYKCIAPEGTSVTGQWVTENWTEINRTVSSLPTPRDGYEAGWEYVVIAPGTYAGKVCEVNDRIMSLNDSTGSSQFVADDDWTVVQGNIDGAVTAANDLDTNTLVLGNGNKTVKKLSNGSAGQWLRIVDGRPQWAGHPNTDHGIASCVCDTLSNNQVKVASLISGTDSSFKLVSGAIVSVLFEHAIINDDSNTRVTLIVGGSTAYPIYANDENITTGYVDDGNTATFMFDGGAWIYLAVDKKYHPVATSGDYNDLSNKPIHGVINNTQAAGTTSFTITVPEASNAADQIFCVKFANGITFSTNVSVKLTVKKSVSETTILEAPIMWHSNNIDSGMIKSNDTVTLLYDGQKFVLLSIDRKINSVITSNTTNGVTTYDDSLVTDRAVFDYVNQQIDANALWWEELQSTNP